MKVADLMSTDLQTVTGTLNVAEVLTLADAQVYGLPVLEEGASRLIGVLSTSDVLQAAAECPSAEERDQLFENTLVQDLMTASPASVTSDDDVRQAAQQMLYLDVHRLFVVDSVGSSRRAISSAPWPRPKI